MAEKQISIKLADDIIQTLDSYAERFGKSRHDLIKLVLEKGVAEINDFKKVGIFQVGMMLRDLHFDIKDKFGLKTKSNGDGEGKPIPVKLSDEFISQLDQLAERTEVSRHKLMQNFIKVELQELVFLDKTCALKVAITLHDIGKGIGKIYELGKKAFNGSNE